MALLVGLLVIAVILRAVIERSESADGATSDQDRSSAILAERVNIQRLTKSYAFAGDLKFSDRVVVAGGACLQHAQCALHLGAGLDVLEQYDVVGDVRHAEFAESADAEEFDCFVGEHQADLESGAALHE